MAVRDDSLEILIRGSLDLKSTTTEINKQLKNINLHKLNLNVNIDTSTVHQISSQIKQLQKQLGKTNNVKMFNVDETRKWYASVQDAVNEYKKIGTVNISQNIDPATKKIRDFTLEVKKANQEIERVKFSPVNIADGSTAFQAESIKAIDKTAELKKKALVEEEKTRLALIEQAKAEEAQRERVLQAEHKIKAAIEKNVQSEQKKTEELQRQVEIYKQQAQINAQNLRSRYKNKIDDTGLSQYLNDVDQLDHKNANVKKSMEDLNLGFKKIEANARQAASAGLSFGEMFSQAMVKFPIWMAASTAFFGTFAILREAITYINELNKSLTEISIVTGQTQSQVAKLGLEYQKLAVEMGVTTNEIAKASVEFYRQGLSQSEVMDRMRVTTQYAKISNLEFKESAEILTATVNSMGISIERASDVFAYLGDATATGADEIGKAFQRVGGSAGALDLSFEKTASWIAVLSSRTREGAGTIGNSIKSILARIQNLTETGFDEVDGTSINQVAKALDAVNIKLVDGEGQFRNFGDVMDELGSKWSSLDSRTKAYLSTTIAGTFQQSRFLNLMEGYQDTIPLYEQALQAAGTTTQKFGQYQDGTEAAINRLKASLEGLWQTMLNSQAINGFLETMTQLVQLLNKVSEKQDGFIGFLQKINEYNPLASAAPLTRDFLKGQAESASIERHTKEQTDIIFKSLSTQREEIQKLISTYQELNAAKDSMGNAFLGSEQEQKYLDVQTKLSKLLPTLVAGYDEKGQAILKTNQLLQEELKVAEEIYQSEKQRRSISASEDFGKKQEEIAKQVDLVVELRNKLEQALKDGDLDLAQVLRFQYSEENSNLLKLKSDLSQSVADFQSIQQDLSGIKLGDQYQKIVNDVISSIDFSDSNFDEQKKKLEELNKYIKSLQFTNETQDISSDNKAKMFASLESGIRSILSEFGRSPEEIRKFIDAIKQTKTESNNVGTSLLNAYSIQQQLNKSYEDTAKQVEPLNELLQKLAEGKSISADEAMKLIQQEEGLVDAFTIENGIVKVNIQAIQALRDAKISSFDDMIKAKEIELQNNFNALKETLKLYDIELGAIENLADAKIALAAISRYDENGRSSEVANASKQVAEMIKLKEQLDGFRKFSTEALKSVGTSDTKSKTAKSEYAPMTEDAKKLLAAEYELKKIRQEQADLAEHSSAYRENLTRERQEIEKIIVLKQKELATIEKTQKIGGKSNKIGGSIKDSNEALKESYKLKEELEDLKNQLTEVSAKEESSMLVSFAKQIEQIDSKLEEHKYLMEDVNTASQEYRNGLDYDISKLQEKANVYQKEIEYLNQLVLKYGENSKKGSEYKTTLEQMMKALIGVNKELKDKDMAKFNSQIEQGQQMIDEYGHSLEQSKGHMSSLKEGSSEWLDELEKQRNALKGQRAINQVMIDITKKKLANLPKESQGYKDLENQLRSLQSAQLGYNNALKETSFLQAKVAKSEREWEEAKEKAQNIKESIMDALSKVLDSIQLEVEIDFDNVKQNLANALAELKNLNGEFFISDQVESLDTLKDVESAIIDYVFDLQEFQKKTNDLINMDRSFQEENLTAIEKEAKHAEKIKKELKETTELLNQKKFQYQQIEKSLEYQIKLLEEQRDKVLEGLRDQMEVTPDFSMDQFKDDLAELLASQGLSIHGLGIDLSDATIIGDVPSDIRTIVGDLLSENANMDSLTNEFSEQSKILEEQAKLREELLKLEKEGKETTEEYAELKKKLEEADKAAIESRQEMQELIEQEIGQLNELREEEKAIREEIQERENLYKQQVKAIGDQIEATNRLYDEQIKQQQERLKQFEEQNEQLDRQIERTRLLQELENAKDDKRFEYINEQGQIELTYDKGRVAELERDLADFDREVTRDNQRKQIEDEIDRLEESRDRHIQILERNLEQLKETHEREIAQLNFYLNQNKVLQDKLVYNINQHITQLEQSFNSQIEFENARLERMRALHEAEIQAMEAYIEGLNTQLDKIEEDVGKRIDRIGELLEEFVSDMSESALDWQTIIYRLKELSSEIGNIKITPPSFSIPSSSGGGAKEEKHIGGFVGNKSPSKIASLANRVFNGIGSEKDIRSLVGELQIPPQNLGSKLRDNLRRIVSYASTNNHSVASNDTIYQVHIDKIVSGASTFKDLIRDINVITKAKQV